MTAEMVAPSLFNMVTPQIPPPYWLIMELPLYIS